MVVIKGLGRLHKISGLSLSSKGLLSKQDLRALHKISESAKHAKGNSVV